LWYLRRSRKRFHDDSQDRTEAMSAFYYVLLNITKLISPIMPFFAEEMYQNLKTKNMPESIHLCDWPQLKEESFADLELEGKMDEVRNIVNLALAERSEKSIKVRQPIASIKIKNKKLKIEGEKDILELIKDEVNVKQIIFGAKIKNEVEIDTTITEELKKEGNWREYLRQVKEFRKELKMMPEDKPTFLTTANLAGFMNESEDYFKKEIGVKEIIEVKNENEMQVDAKKEIVIDDKKYFIGIKK